MVDVIFAKQDSFGLKSWKSYAIEAGVSDTATFSRCTEAVESPELVSRGSALATDMGLLATPTVIVNGWRLALPPQGAQLETMVKRIIDGEPVEKVLKSLGAQAP
jgi:protein-disulfide isomerase